MVYKTCNKLCALIIIRIEYYPKLWSGEFRRVAFFVPIREWKAIKSYNTKTFFYDDMQKCTLMMSEW